MDNTEAIYCNMKGKQCPIAHPNYLLCQEGYCSDCEIWRVKQAEQTVEDVANYLLLEET